MKYHNLIQQTGDLGTESAMVALVETARDLVLHGVNPDRFEDAQACLEQAYRIASKLGDANAMEFIMRCSFHV